MVDGDTGPARAAMQRCQRMQAGFERSVGRAWHGHGLGAGGDGNGWMHLRRMGGRMGGRRDGSNLCMES